MNSILATPKKWKRLGFRSGLEIHHQIRTEKKLFCKCPAGRYSETWHAEVMRHMRPTMSELGEYDGTALMEFKTKKDIIYRLNRDTVCTYEMDDNPPFLINEEAVDKALVIALALGCKIVGELHVMRKQYLDGSIPTGFQRTAIIGVDGMIPLSSGKEIRIIQLGLEEDACREVSDSGHRITFMTDRLSMPLVEVVTDSDFSTPQEVAEGAMRIGRLLRTTGLVRRGIGCVRQDVNVSIEGGTRVEIKGVPRIPLIPRLVAHEALRQEALIRLAGQLRKRGFKPGDRPGGHRKWDYSDGRLNRLELSVAISAGNAVRIITLPEARGLVSWPLSGGRLFADELSERVRVVACLDRLPNLFHDDGVTGGLEAADARAVAGFAGCGPKDVALTVYGPEEDTVTACEEILDRWALAIEGVPNETRQVRGDGTTGFERVLPGPDRMYPDTDSPPYGIAEKRIEAASSLVPEMPWERESRYFEMGLPEDIVNCLSISRHAPLFDRLVAEKAVSPIRAGEVLTRMRVAVRRSGAGDYNISQNHWEQLLRALGSERIFREGLMLLIETWAKKPDMALDEILASLGWSPVDRQHMEGAVGPAVEQAKREQPNDPALQPAIAMGLAMSSLIGRAPGKRVRRLVDLALE